MDKPAKLGVEILYAEDDPISGRLIRSIAESEGYSLTIVPTGEEFLRVLFADRPDLILLDLHLPDASGLDLLARSRARYPDVPVIVATASSSVNNVVAALKGGAMDYLTKPVDHQRLVVSLSNAVKISRQQQDLSSLRSELKETYRLEHLVGTSQGMSQVRDII